MWGEKVVLGSIGFHEDHRHQVLLDLELQVTENQPLDVGAGN